MSGRARTVVAALALAVISVGCTTAFAESAADHPPHAARRDGASAPLPLAAVGGESDRAATDPIVAFIEGVVREQERLAAEEAERLEAARRAADQPRVAGGTGSSGSGVGDCTGFAIPDYIIARESGGDPYAVNPSSGAFGCAQVMPFHWAPGGACAGLDPYSIDDQRTCVEWLSQGGTRLSPWGG